MLMKDDRIAEKRTGFHLEKWFLDCVSEEGEVMIFYAANLRWHKWKVPYTSWLHYAGSSDAVVNSRFTKINIPEREGESIQWQDDRFGVSGSWEAIAPPLNARLFDSEDGYLDWHCYQPLSRVRLNLKDRIVEGLGYAEKLILSVEPWKIPMDELRWGRYCSEEDNIVWIELRGEGEKQWLWHNGERLNTVKIEDGKLMMPDKGLALELDKRIVLESEKKIFNVVKSLLSFIPGFSRSMSSRFLMSDESKWCSHGVLRKNNNVVSQGWAIHECINFKD